MRAFPVGLLLLALALIAAAHMMKAACGDITVKRMTHRMLKDSYEFGEDGEEKVAEGDTTAATASSKVTARLALETSGGSKLPVATTLAAAARSKVTARVVLETTSSTTTDSTTGTPADGGGSLADGIPNPTRSILNEGSPLQFATTVAVGKARLSFGSQRCVNVSKKARGKGAQVWWKGANSKAKGFSCSQIKFFGKGGCQGEELDSMVNPGTATAAKFPSNKKALSNWASVASVLCTDAPRVAPVWWMRRASATASGVSSQAPQECLFYLASVLCVDAPCDALGCEPGGTCVVDENGERYCQWDSPCGACPTGATCKTVPATNNGWVRVPYCACPSGYGMTPTGCVDGEVATVASYSATYIVNRTANDYTSRPYTFRLNRNGCTQYPDAVAGKFTSVYIVDNIDDAPWCPKFQVFSTDNCEGPSDYDDKGSVEEMFLAGYSL
ncbi:unnamed protein product, partial [Closterium sp. Naga37s-1]